MAPPGRSYIRTSDQQVGDRARKVLQVRLANKFVWRLRYFIALDHPVGPHAKFRALRFS